MIVKCTRAKKTGKVDCYEICPESVEEEALMTAIIDNNLNIKTMLHAYLKEDKVKKKVEHVVTCSVDTEHNKEEYRHR